MTLQRLVLGVFGELDTSSTAVYTARGAIFLESLRCQTKQTVAIRLQ